MRQLPGAREMSDAWTRPPSRRSHCLRVRSPLLCRDTAECTEWLQRTSSRAMVMSLRTSAKTVGEQNNPVEIFRHTGTAGYELCSSIPAWINPCTLLNCVSLATGPRFITESRTSPTTSFSAIALCDQFHFVMSVCREKHTSGRAGCLATITHRSQHTGCERNLEVDVGQ